MQRFDAHIQHLELVLEGQDAGATREHAGIGELGRRAEPDRVARDIERTRTNARVRTPGPARIESLRAAARYHRARYDLYRAKMYGPRPTTMGRLQELERAHQGADARLRRAERDLITHERD